MSRLILRLPVVASVLFLGVSCSKRAKPASELVRNCDVPGTFDAIAKLAGVIQSGFTFTSANNAIDGKANWTANVRYCARPDQIDEAMRVMHAEFVKLLRDNGAEPRGYVPLAGPAAVKGWTIIYTTGAQEGTIRVTRDGGKPGQCPGKDQLEYAIDFVLDEAPKAAPQ
jgi:hypothetical protein